MGSIELRSALVLGLALLLVSPTFAGGISGTISYNGAAPPTKGVKMDADPGCAKMHSTPPPNEGLVLGDGSTVGNVFVHVKSGLAKKDYPAPSDAVVIDQDGCRYSPHVLGVMVNQPIKIKNSDGLLHNVHALPEINKQFNMAMPASRTEADAKFDKEEAMFKIKCDVHPWMGAWVSVMSHPFFDVTGKDGKFSIDGLAPGTYTIEAWHEWERDSNPKKSKIFQPQTATVTIGSDSDVQTADFTFTGPGAK